MLRQEARNSRGVVGLLSGRVEISHVSLVVEDRRVDTHPATRRSCTHSEVPVFRAGQRFIKAGDRVEYLSKKEPRCLDCVTALVEGPLVGPHLGPITLADRSFGYEHGCSAGKD